MPKDGLGINVLDAARERISIVFDNFLRVYLSFSGGKDSSVMMHLACEEARRRRYSLGALFVDLEAQYQHTIQHIHEILDEYQDCITPYWVCLPLSLRNAVSVYEPKWQCWEPGKEEMWVRKPPKMAITDQGYFPFFEQGMELEEFTPKFGEWYSEGLPTACLVGLRTDESLDRFRTIKNQRKKTFAGHQWTTKLWSTMVYNCYPIYDWRTKDIWIYNSKFQAKYNKLYDLMHQAGLSIHQQRICQPYGDDQRKGLSLFQKIEPETWSKVVARVAGVNSGSSFVQFNGNASGQIKISKPDGHTWESFASLLLESMPESMKEHYKNKIYKFLRWYAERGYPNGIPDEGDPKEEASRNVPSWRRICKMLLRNDYWAKGLSFSQTKHGYFYQQYMKRIKEERKKWKDRIGTNIL